MSFFSAQNPGIGGLDELTDSEEAFLVSLVNQSYSEGDILFHDGSGFVRLPIGSSGEVLKVDTGVPVWGTGGGGGASALSDLTDVDASVASPSDGDIIVYRSSGNDWVLESKPAGGSNPAMADITDVTITSVSDDEVLAYDTTSGEFINQTAAEAGLAAASHNHTASEISDFDTEVSNNTDVAANTSDRHSAATVTDTPTVDLTISGQDIQGDVISQMSVTSDASGIKL